MFSDRILPRKYARFLTDDTVFARVNNDYSKLSKVKDIGLGGMAFIYISDHSICSDCICCDIIITDDSCSISNFSCAVVYQERLFNTTVKDNVSIQVSRCGVLFRNMSSEQQRKLINLITNFCLS